MSHLGLLLKPASYHCNLVCDYCFYKRVSQVYPDKKARMTKETAARLIQQLLCKDFTSYAFCWQGGEPTLMGLDFFRAVAAAQKKYARPGQIIENTIQTNGILLNAHWARFLREKRFLVGLSLDGPKDIHDQYRRQSGDRGTWEQVMEKVTLLKQNLVNFNILTLLTQANIAAPERLYAFFREHRLNYLQFIPCIERHDHIHKLRDFSITGEELGRFYCRIFDAWVEDGFPEVSIRLFEDILIYMLDGVKVSCAWRTSCDSYLVVEHNGDAYPCDFFVYPEWKLGNILEDRFEDIQNSILRRQFADMKSDCPEECRSCQWKGFCEGDCTKFRYDSAGAYRARSELCRSWRMLLAHIASHPIDIRTKAMEARRVHQEKLINNTGRNDPCPCGSGKKFKKCCLPRTRGDGVHSI